MNLIGIRGSNTQNHTAVYGTAIKILDDVKNMSQELKFISMSKTNKDVSINLDIKPKKFRELSKFSDSINKKFPNSKVIVSQNNDLSI